MVFLLNALFFLALSLYLGSIFFLSFFTAPTLFRELPREMAGEFLGKLFPQYYMIGYVTLSLAFLSLALRGFFLKPFPWLRLALILLMFGCVFEAGTRIQPRVHALRGEIRAIEEGPEKQAKQAEFSKLHQRSVVLNGAVFILGLVVLLLSV